MPNPEAGLYKKYKVVKLDPQGGEIGEVKDFTFTLLPEKDPAALKALVTYALNADEPLRSELLEKVTEIESDLGPFAPSVVEFGDDDDEYCQNLLATGEYEAYGEECDEVDG